MAKSVFQDGQRLPAEWVNAMQDITFDGQDIDGHYPPLTDASLSSTAGNIKPEFYGFRDAGRVTHVSGLNVSVAAFTIGLQNGTRASIATTQLTMTDNATRIVFVDNNGNLQSAGSAPEIGVLLARVVTSGGTVSTIADLRERANYQVRPISIPATVQFVMPPGSVIEYAGSVAPTGWLLCDGSEVSRTTYADLFTAIGTAFGTPSSGSVFRLPDHRNRVGRGVGAGTALASTGGADNVTLNTNQMPSHNHSLTVSPHSHSISDPGHGHTTFDPGHYHSIYAFTGSTAATNDGFGTGNVGISGEIEPTKAYIIQNSNGNQLIGNATTGVQVLNAGTNIGVNSASVSITMANAGGATPVDVRNQFIGMNYIIKT